MEREIYQNLSEIENIHWWFTGRRNIVSSLLEKQSLPSNADILEAGCGSGGNLPMLAKFGNLRAFEYDAEMCAKAQARNIGEVVSGKLPDNIPFGNQAFDLVAMFDVLEHVPDDRASLAALRARLKPGGLLLLTVPAFQFLWSEHDVAHHHQRRYEMKQLTDMVTQAGFDITLASHFNFWLFPVIAGMRVAERLMPKRIKKVHGVNVPSPGINAFLTQLFTAEKYLIDKKMVPFGISIILIARAI